MGNRAHKIPGYHLYFRQVKVSDPAICKIGAPPFGLVVVNFSRWFGPGCFHFFRRRLPVSEPEFWNDRDEVPSELFVFLLELLAKIFEGVGVEIVASQKRESQVL
jgi:hypothetical protein